MPEFLGLRSTATLDSEDPSRLRKSWIAALVVALGCHLLWQAHGISSGGFQNLDVAGIVYNARLLLAGRLPYVDSVEIKPPGAFLLFAPWLALGGLKAVWWFSAFWGAMTSLATGWMGALCWGNRFGPRIAILHAAGAAVAADGDINYSFWMTLPFVLSAAFAVRAARSAASRRSDWSLAVASGLAAFAVLVRPSASTLLLVLAAPIAIRLHRKAWGASLRGVLFGSLGVLSVAVLVASPFLRGGSLEAMIHGYTSVRHYADESITSILVGAGGRLPATFNGLQCLPDQLPVYHLLLAVALLPAPATFAVRDEQRFGWMAWLFGLASLVGISLTLRFFTHDNAPIWPAWTILILRPRSLIGMLVEYVARAPFLELASAFVLGVLAPLSNWQSLTWLQRYMHESDAQVQKLCSRLLPHIDGKETVLAWGWTAWGVYEHCGRWAPGPVYKDLTTVTTPNTNTCNRGYEPPRLKNGPFTERYLRDLQERRPALIVVSDYYRGLGGDPLDEWVEARRFMREHYLVYDHLGGFEALIRRDLGASAGISDQQSDDVLPVEPTVGTELVREEGSASAARPL